MFYRAPELPNYTSSTLYRSILHYSSHNFHPMLLGVYAHVHVDLPRNTEA